MVSLFESNVVSLICRELERCQLENSIDLRPGFSKERTDRNFLLSNLVLYNTDTKVRFKLI